MDGWISIVINYCTSFLAGYSVEAVKHFFGEAVKLNPALSSKVMSAKNSKDLEQVIKDATSVINANAGDSSIKIDGGLLEALNGIKFDHNNGNIIINGSMIKASKIEYGGNSSSTGQTTIRNTTSKTGSTSIVVSGDAIIEVTGNSKIMQNGLSY